MEKGYYKITNSKGVTLDLMDWSSVAFFEQKGLGFDEDADYMHIGTRWIPYDISLKQNEISGKMVFIGMDNYQKYFDFVQFAKSTPLTMEYRTDAGTFYIDVRLSRIDKAEADRNTSWLVSSVTFSALGLFYQLHNEVIAEPIEETENVYPFTYPLDYAAETQDYIRIYIPTVSECPILLTIYGEAENPEWTHYLNGVLVENGKYNGTVEDGEKLVIDDRSVPYSIELRNAETDTLLEDAYQDCDFSTERFFVLGQGQNVIRVAHDGAQDLTFSVIARVEYESV